MPPAKKTVDPNVDPNADPNADGDDLDERIAQLVETRFGTLFNKAFTEREKRQGQALEKVIGEQLTKALAAQGQSNPATGGDPTRGTEPGKGTEPGGVTRVADPEVIRLREQVEKLTKQSDDERKQRLTVEEKSRKDSARTLLREQFEAKGIKGARAAALISHMEGTGALRFDEDGRPLLAVKRSRAKGAAAEEYEFDDFKAGVEDWTKTSEAEEFLPPQTVQTPTRRQAPGTFAPGGGRRPVAAARPERPLTEDESADRMAESLARSGVNLDRIAID